MHSGCRISEALKLTGNSFDFETKRVTFQTLKKSKAGVFRSVPISPEFLHAINLVYRLRTAKEKALNKKLWSFSRMTGYRRITEVMTRAEIIGPQATPKGLRHGFGMKCAELKIPLNMIQKWMGHSQMETTAIYLNAMGDEERDMASGLWST